MSLPPIDAEAVDAALRAVIEELDYDIHKNLECDEEDGEDHYDELVDTFIDKYLEKLGWVVNE